MKNWEDIYKLPLKKDNWTSWVWDNAQNFVFQFEPKYDDKGEYIKGYKDFENAILESLNTGNPLQSKKNWLFKYENGDITMSDLDEEEQDPIHIITIRGWGGLTGIGGHQLPPEEAANIQDTFAEWIVETLNKK